MTRLRVFAGVIATIGSLGLASTSQAAPIIYTVALTASGSLGGQAFTNAAVTVTLVGDTAGVLQPLPVDLPELLVNPGTATVTVAGLATATFNDPGGYAVLAFPVIPGEIPLPSVGIWENIDLQEDHGVGIVGIGGASLAGYNLQSPLVFSGAASGGATEGGNPFAYSTNLGAFVITSTGDEGTLTVTLPTQVPEPTSLSLLGVGGLSLLAAMRRRKK